jgi:hypothetical protein
MRVEIATLVTLTRDSLAMTTRSVVILSRAGGATKNRVAYPGGEGRCHAMRSFASLGMTGWSIRPPDGRPLDRDAGQLGFCVAAGRRPAVPGSDV